MPPSLAQMCFHQCKVYKSVQFWNDILRILHEFFESNICLTPKVLRGSLNRKGFSLLFSFHVPWFSLKSQYPYIVGADMVEKVQKAERWVAIPCNERHDYIRKEQTKSNTVVRFGDFIQFPINVELFYAFSQYFDI